MGIEGRLTQRKYTDREGIQRIAIEVIASDVQFLDKRQEHPGEEDLPVDVAEIL